MIFFRNYDAKKPGQSRALQAAVWIQKNPLSGNGQKQQSTAHHVRLGEPLPAQADIDELMEWCLWGMTRGTKITKNGEITASNWIIRVEISTSKREVGFFQMFLSNAQKSCT